MTQLLNLVAKTFKYEKRYRLKWQRIRKKLESLSTAKGTSKYQRHRAAVVQRL